MKLGFVSAILDGWTFEGMVGRGRGDGLPVRGGGLLACGKAGAPLCGREPYRRDALDDEKVRYIHGYLEQRGVEISALAYYPNTLDGDLEKRAAAVEHLKKVIRASHKLGVNLVTTFIGRDQTKTVEENLDIMCRCGRPSSGLPRSWACASPLRTAPCSSAPISGPGGQNLMTTPAIWRKVFERLPSPNLGINYDPSHFVWQMMDYIQPLYAFKDRIFHVHYKDIKLFPDKLRQVGTMAYPLDYMSPKLPGLGDVDWGRYVSALTDIGYDGYTCIEVEDRSFEGSREKVLDSLRLSKRYMEQFVI